MKTLTSTETKKKAHLSVQLETQEKADLEMIARGKDRSVHYLMREAVREYIQEEKAKIAFYERGLSAIADYDATGLHTTFEEMKTWAKDRKQNTSLPVPPCHA
jgi:predicted transcriptional regulator